MAHKKAGGTAKNLSDSNPQYLGVKRGDGSSVKVSEIIVRQRGTKIEAGKNIFIGKDHTLHAKKAGRVSFDSIRKTNFDGHIVVKKRVSVI